MKPLFKLLLGVILLTMVCTASAPILPDAISLACMRRHSASNTCHYNFTIEGINYCYLDKGCKAKRDEVIKKVQEGKLGLAKDWKVVCVSK